MTDVLALSEERLEAVSRRIVGTLFLTQSLGSAAIINAFTVTPIIAAALAGTDRVAGLPSSLVYLGQALMAYPMGWMLDRYGRRQGISVAFVIGVMGALVSLLAVVGSNFTLFLGGSLLFGMMRSGGEQSRYVAAEVSRVSNRARVIGIVVFAGTAGSIVGPALVSPAAAAALSLNLPEHAGPFGVASILLTVCAVVIFSLLRPDPLKIGRQVAELDDAMPVDGVIRERAEAGPIRSVRQIYSSRVPRLAVIAMVFGQLVMSMLMVITPLHMAHNDHSLGSISNVIMAHTMGMFGLSWLTGWLIDRVGRYPVIAGGALLLISAAIIAPISPLFIPLALALFLLGLGWNFCYVAGSSLLSDQLKASERGRAQGASEMMVAIGAGGGSLLSGVLFDAGGILSVSGLGLVMALLLLAITIYVATRRS
jgi:MFS family permease